MIFPKLKITGWKERGRAYFREGIYARHALSGFVTVYIICFVMGLF